MEKGKERKKNKKTTLSNNNSSNYLLQGWKVGWEELHAKALAN